MRRGQCALTVYYKLQQCTNGGGKSRVVDIVIKLGWSGWIAGLSIHREIAEISKKLARSYILYDFFEHPA